MPFFGSGVSQTETLNDPLTDSAGFFPVERGDRAAETDSARDGGDSLGAKVGLIGTFPTPLDELSLLRSAKLVRVNGLLNLEADGSELRLGTGLTGTSSESSEDELERGLFGAFAA
jgi:hypothetical protein